MQLPPKTPDAMFEEILADLPPEIEAMAREFKAFCRARKVKTPLQMLRIVMLYCGLDFTLRDTAADFTLLYVKITDSAIEQRLQAARPWVKALLPKMLNLPTIEIKFEDQYMRFLVVDATTVNCPGAKGTSYRIHICMDMIKLEFISVKVTDKHTGETLKNFQFRQGDVIVGDRGYCHREAICDLFSKGAELIVRLNPHILPLYKRDGKPLEIAKELKDQLPGTLLTLEVTLSSKDGKELINSYVHAYRLPPQEAERARRRCRLSSQKHGRTPKEETLFLSEFVLIFTTISPEILSAQTVLSLYSCRWQIEIAIKRWKSLLNLDELRAREGSPLAELWLHGKLLYALMLERRMGRKLGREWGHLDGERNTSWWRIWKLLKQEIDPIISGSFYWDEARWNEARKVISERPRSRKLQHLPAPAIEVLHNTNEVYDLYDWYDWMAA